MVLRLLNRMESTAGDPFIPVHPRWWLLQTLGGFIGVLVRLLVELLQLMKKNGRVVIYCTHRHLLSSFSSTPGVKQTSARSIHQGVVHTLAALIMGKCFDKVYLSPTFLYYFVFEELLAWMQRSHRAQYGTCAEPPHVGAANRPCYWTIRRIHPYLETDIMSIHSRLEVLHWQFPCRSFCRASSSSPCCGCQIYSVWVLLPNYFYFVPYTIHFFFMELSQSATKRIFSDGAAEAHIIGFIQNSN